MVQFSQESGRKFRAIRLSIHSFTRTAPSFACFALLASHCSIRLCAPLRSLVCLLAHFAHSLARRTVNDWMAILSVFFSIFDHSVRMRKAIHSNLAPCRPLSGCLNVVEVVLVNVIGLGCSFVALLSSSIVLLFLCSWTIRMLLACHGSGAHLQTKNSIHVFFYKNTIFKNTSLIFGQKLRTF